MQVVLLKKNGVPTSVLLC